ncbi:Transmembrane protease, serine 4, partial [Cricetulus griseus]
DITAFHKPRRPLEIFKKVGIPIIAVLLSLAAIATVAIIIKVVLVRYYFICESPLAFIPREQVCDGHLDCALGEDEEHCVKNFPEKPGVTVRLSKHRSTLQVLDAATGTWASACFDNFTEALAKTACRQMGYDRKYLDVSNWKVRAGSDKLGHTPSLPVAKIFVTEHNALYPKEKDIALIKLQVPLTFSDTVRPICLPFSDEELIPGTPLWVIGWGFTEQNGGSMSDVLLQASIQLIDSTRCNAEDAYQGEVTSEMVCAGTPQGGVDACQGDSGGPLMYHSGHWQIVGIVSWGYGCGSPSTPGVYTKVSAFLNWIYNVRKVSV